MLRLGPASSRCAPAGVGSHLYRRSLGNTNACGERATGFLDVDCPFGKLPAGWQTAVPGSGATAAPRRNKSIPFIHLRRRSREERALARAVLCLATPVPREEDDVTLRIKRVDGPASQVTLLLEGRLVGEWAALVRRECHALLRWTSEVELDLSGVSYVDTAGIEALAWLDRA